MNKDKFELGSKELESFNSLFSDNEPVFKIDYTKRTFNYAINRDDTMGRLDKKIQELLKDEYNPYNDLTPEQKKEYFKRIFG